MKKANQTKISVLDLDTPVVNRLKAIAGLRGQTFAGLRREVLEAASELPLDAEALENMGKIRLDASVSVKLES